MKVCGIVINKRKIVLSLVHHYKIRPLQEGPYCRLEKIGIIYIPRLLRHKPMDIDYKIKSLPFIKEADFVHIIYDYRKSITGDTAAFKELILVFITDFLESINKPYLAEASRAIKYRMGGGEFTNSKIIMQWMSNNVDNYERIKILGKRQEDYQKLLSIIAACSTKGLKKHKKTYFKDMIRIKTL